MDIGDAIMLPLGLVLVSVMMGIGLIVNNDIFDVLEGQDQSGWSNATIESFNGTRDSLISNTYQGFDLGALLPIVFGASAVISVVVSAFLVFNE